MNCQDIKRLLDDCDLETLSAAERGEAERHLAACPECAREWDAYASVLAARIPALPEDLAPRCRALAAAASAATSAPRARVRPTVVAGMLLVAAAAAAVVGVQWTADAPEEPATQTAEGVDVNAADPEAQTTLAAPGDAAAADGTATAAPATRSASDGAAAGPGTFTVAVPPLVHETPNPDVATVAGRIYAAVLEDLRALPNLVLVELNEPLADSGPLPMSVGFAPVLAGPPPPNGATEIVATELRIDTTPASAGAVSVSASGAIAGADAPYRDFTLEFHEVGAPGDPAPAQFFSVGVDSGDVAPLTPETGGRELVNVILHAEAGVAPAPEARGDGAEAPSGDPAPVYDFVLRMTTSARLNAAPAQPETYMFSVVGSKGRSRKPQVSLVMSGSAYDPIDVDALAHQTVAQLRKLLFEPDEILIEQLQSVVLDTSAITAERLKALSDLALIAGRSGRDGRTGAVVAAVIEIAARASSGPERARVWQVMAGADDPRLVGPLVDTLLYDTAESVRFEAAALLETFASDPTAQAALTQAGSFDTAPAVRERATWSALSAQGRRDYVSAALVDASLSDADRVAPLTYGADAPGSPSGPRPEPGLLADGAAATALVGIIARSNDVRFKAPLLLHLGAIDQPDVVAFLIDKVSSDPAEVIRSIAVEALRGRVADPNVRAVLESARASDASSEVRGAAASVLDAGA